MSGCDEEHGGGVGADSVEAKEAGGADGDERNDQLAQPVDLGVEELPRRPRSRDLQCAVHLLMMVI
jgi:hypothetical protein